MNSIINRKLNRKGSSYMLFTFKINFAAKILNMVPYNIKANPRSLVQ